MNINQDIGLQIPQILLPKPSVDPYKWSVIACDQFTSQPDYWQEVAQIVGDAPSTYHMILPEVYLETSKEEKRIQSTHTVMKDYLQSGIFSTLDGFIYVNRTVGNRTRCGLMVCLDLEQYDYTSSSQTLIRATEGTIIDRLPPRIRIREQAPLECPHILVLFDDPNNTVLGPLNDKVDQFKLVYDFDLMLESGHLKGYAIDDTEDQNKIMNSLHQLIEPELFAEKYDLEQGQHQPLLFAMGDGNHSLATAKAIWEQLKPSVSMDHPARYALVEIINVHDPALTFEPIHRVLFNINQDLIAAMRNYWGDRLVIQDAAGESELTTAVNNHEQHCHQVGMLSPDGLKIIQIHNPQDNLAVGTLQKFLDEFIEANGAEKIDYVHGTDVLFDIGKQDGNTGFYVPGIVKSDLFKTVILDGALPRKTFSMGTAKEKRFYMECRRIIP